MSKYIKTLKTGEFKCDLCNIKFSTRELAVNHLKTTKHLQHQQAEQQSKIHLLESQNVQMDSEVLSSKLDLILHKLDLMSERTTRLEMRIEKFEDQFDAMVLKPRIHQQNLSKSIEQDEVLRHHLDEVRQIEIAEKLIKTKVESLQKSRAAHEQPPAPHSPSCTKCGSLLKYQ